MEDKNLTTIYTYLMYYNIYIYYRSAILGIIFLGEFGFLIVLDLGLWQFKPHTRPTSTAFLINFLEKKKKK